MFALLRLGRSVGAAAPLPPPLRNDGTDQLPVSRIEYGESTFKGHQMTIDGGIFSSRGATCQQRRCLEVQRALKQGQRIKRERVAK